MPFKLIGILLLVVLVATLSGFNLDNKCSIWFIKTFTDVPVFPALLTAFVAGVIITLPFTIGKRRKDPKSPKEKHSADAKRPRAESTSSIASSSASSSSHAVSQVTQSEPKKDL